MPLVAVTVSFLKNKIPYVYMNIQKLFVYISYAAPWYPLCLNLTDAIFSLKCMKVCAVDSRERIKILFSTSKLPGMYVHVYSGIV